MKISSTRITGLAIACTLLCGLSLVSTPPAGAAEEAGGAQAQFLAQKCNTCHGVSAVGIEAKVKSEKMKGPDLSGFAEEDIAGLAAYLRKEGERNGQQHKKKNEISEEEVQSLVDWLSGLEPAGGGR